MSKRVKRYLRIPLLASAVVMAAVCALTVFRTVQNFRLNYAFGTHDYVGARRILEQGADPNGRQGSNGSLLRHAVTYGDAKATELLLHFGANPNLKDQNGNTALEYCGEGSTEEVINLVKKYGGKSSYE